MEPGAAQVGVGVSAPAPVLARCPLCDASVAPDALGFTECACGWEGPGDPLETGRGLAHAWRRMDRRLATSQAHKDLKRLLAPGARVASIGIGYSIVLFLASTCIYLLLYALLAASIYFGYYFATDGAWGGVAVCLFGVALALFMLYRRSPRPTGVDAPASRFPRLAAALTEVSQRVGAPVPHRVVLTPGAEAFVYSHRPLHRFFRRELVLGLGVGALPLLSELDLKATLAHELAHFRHGDHSLHRIYGGAENALARLVYILRDDPRSNRVVIGRRGRSQTGDALVDALMALVMCPAWALWAAFHMLRLRESRTAEYAADHIAAQCYGPLAVINGLTGLCMARDTMHGGGQSLVAEMRKRGGSNLYAVLRNHYAGLPPALISQLRVKAARDFRTLARTHPATPDRLRAVYGLGIPSPSEPYRPAVDLLVPADASSADAVETALTKLLLK